MIAIALTTRIALCSACGVFAAVQRVAPASDLYAVAGWCPVCRANRAHACTPDVSVTAAGHLDRALTGAR